MSLTLDAQLEAAKALDTRLKALVAAERQAEADVAYALYEMSQKRLYLALAYPRLADYAHHELGVSAAKAKDLVEIVAKCEGLPRVREAFRTGQVSWTKARQVVRIADVETEEHWLEE